MVVLNKIYTRTGDDGTTALGTGERRKKYDLRIAAYGTLDETNAAIGIARLHTAGRRRARSHRSPASRTICSTSAPICARRARARGRAARGSRSPTTQVTWLESEIDRLNAGTRSRCDLSSCPAAARRGLSASRPHHMPPRRAADRRACRTEPDESVTPEVLKYVNRLSDFLFVAARYANDQGARDVLWQPGQNR